MAKSVKSSGDISKTACPSSFTLTFVVEVLGIDVFHDCNEGWLDLVSGPVQGMKLQYQLAPGFAYDADIMIWPHVAKIWSGVNSGWVRTWYFLQRRFLAFTIRHALPVRVADYRDFTATVSLSLGVGNFSSNAKADKSTEVYLPKLLFGDRRQFAEVCEPVEESISKFMVNLIWSCIVKFIPASYNDGPLDTPQCVTDKRHQDAVLDYVQKAILNQVPRETQGEVTDKGSLSYNPKSEIKTKDKEKEKDKKVLPAAPMKFEILLSGDAIISGTGRIIPFKTVGERPAELGEIIVLIGSASLPARDDNPVVFVNCGKLTDIPVEELKKRKITQLYTKWIISDEEHCSEPQTVKNEIDFDDQHSVPLSADVAGDILSSFQDNTFKIEIRGIRQMQLGTENSTFFGYAKADRNFDKAVPPKLPNQDTDILIATTKIDAKCLAKAINTFIKGEFSIYPPEISLTKTTRERICTNDINAVRVPLTPEIIVPAYVIIKAQMTLEASLGLVGCKPHRSPRKYSRLYCLLDDSEAVMSILRHITEINEQMIESGLRDDMLTGFALDTGDKVMLYVEGPRDGQILRVWDITEEFYPKVKPVFSTSAKYCSRLYPELLKAAMPFNVLKMFVPLSVLLACPPIYARPALPIPTRFAVLKIGRVIAGKLLNSPCSNDMPTSDELKSFRLELCVAPRPPPVAMPVSTPVKLSSFVSDPSGTAAVQRINWEQSLAKKQLN